MTFQFRIKYHVVELGKTYSGERVGEESIGALTESFRRRYMDASTIYMELLEVIEKNDEPSVSAESLIILCMTDVYDSFLP